MLFLFVKFLSDWIFARGAWFWMQPWDWEVMRKRSWSARRLEGG